MKSKQIHERADMARKVLALNLPGIAEDTYANRMGAGLPITSAVQQALTENGISVDMLRKAGFVRYGTNQLDYAALNRAIQDQFRDSSTRGPSF